MKRANYLWTRTTRGERLDTHAHLQPCAPTDNSKMNRSGKVVKAAWWSGLMICERGRQRIETRGNDYQTHTLTCNHVLQRTKCRPQPTTMEISPLLFHYYLKISTGIFSTFVTSTGTSWVAPGTSACEPCCSTDIRRRTECIGAFERWCRYLADAQSASVMPS